MTNHRRTPKPSEYLAHISADGNPHALREHLVAVAVAAQTFAEILNSRQWVD
ncbi:MAG: hypothetical protein Q7T97_13970 [Burkholderiaceae bacterium]|nr:hypothetical protein [Burkholderiaceae bacterium]